MTYNAHEFRYMIPSYLNGTLSPKKRRELEDYLNKHPESQHEMLEFSEIKSFYDDKKKEFLPPSDAVYWRIMSNIRAETKPKPASILWQFWTQVKGFSRPLFTSPRVAWAVVAVQVAVILAMALTLPQDNRFKTLSLESATRGNGSIINIVFDQESTEGEIRDILNSMEATIINGPSFEGLYVIRIQKGRDVEETLQGLRKTKPVKFAERSF
jgi:anti-sigma-K factor RskA